MNDDEDDYARYVRRENGRFDVIMARSRRVLLENIGLEQAARMVRETNTRRTSYSQS